MKPESPDQQLPCRKLWLTWEMQRRNAELADAFGCELVVVDFNNSSRWIRYFKSLLASIPFFWRYRRQVIFAQCPSLILVAAASAFSRVLHYRLIIDAHNASFSYLNSSSWLMQLLARFSFSSASNIIVSNELMAQRMRMHNPRVLILPDRLPEILPDDTEGFGPSSLPPPNLVTLIASFSADEPIEEFIEAALKVSLPITLMITGKKTKAGSLLKYERDGIVFTDYLSLKDYEALISRSNLLVDLTSRDDCLVCGGYEALALGVPVILSDTDVLRATFGAGPIYTKNNKEDFIRAIELGLKDPESLKQNMREARAVFLAHWEKSFAKVHEELRRAGALGDAENHRAP